MSDPCDEIRGFGSSYRGGGCFCFGPDVTEKFLARNNLSVLIRSHEMQSKGFDRCHNDKCVTVFSAPNYCGEMGNDAALVRFIEPASMHLKIVTFKCATKKRKKKE